MNDKLKPKRNGNYSHSGNVKHGLYRENKALFNIWQTMKSRCENPNRQNYKNYGGRGIVICEEWETAENFIRWALFNGYNKGLQLDRIDNNKGYSPNNCRWVTPQENSLNRRNTIRLFINGELKTIKELSKEKGISQYTIYWWIKTKGEEYAKQRLS